VTLSLNSRLLLAASVASVAFLGVTGWVLDQAFQNSAETAVGNHLQGQLYGLLAAFDVDDRGRLIVPKNLPEARFSRINSGLYGHVVDEESNVVWASDSLLSRSLPARARLASGNSLFERVTTEDGFELFWLRFGVAWEINDRASVDYEFTVAEDLADYDAQVESFRRSLWIGLGGVVVVLLLVQTAVLRWSLTPLREVAEEVAAVERGESSRLASEYPRELSGLTRNINAFITNERRHIDRYRNTLGDLAHSLKTPMAVIQGALETKQPIKPDEIAAQVDRMSKIVDYQLRRAAAVGKRTLTAPVSVLASVDKVINSLSKVYADRDIQVDQDVTRDLKFYGDEGDLFEVLGNLLDNAFKWSRGRVSVRAEPITGHEHRSGVRLYIIDDGPGIDDSLREQVLKRGIRSDSRVAGQGLGLASVQDVVEAYGGLLHISSLDNRGTEVVVEFPGD
jgi:two-component system sensor histidine kinase PhoQ